MILITFSNNETLEFPQRITAQIHLKILKSFEIRAVKLRCVKSSDYMALQNYIEMLNLIAKT